MRYLLLGLLAIFISSCGDNNQANSDQNNISQDVITGELTPDNLSQDFAELEIDLDFENFDNNVRIYLVDNPTNAKSVKVVLAEMGIRKKGEENSWTRVDLNKQEFELLGLRDGVSDILGDIALEPGEYDLLRLKVLEGNMILNNGESHDLCIPDKGRKSHLNLKIDLVIDEDFEEETQIDSQLNQSGEDSELVESDEHAYGVVVDFDALESIQEIKTEDSDITDSSCTYVLRPMLKLKRAAKLFKKKRRIKRKRQAQKDRLKKAKERFKNRSQARQENRQN